MGEIITDPYIMGRETTPIEYYVNYGIFFLLWMVFHLLLVYGCWLDFITYRVRSCIQYLLIGFIRQLQGILYTHCVTLHSLMISINRDVYLGLTLGKIINVPLNMTLLGDLFKVIQKWILV